MHSPQNAITRGRIAPTPSGFLHIGNAYSFLLTSQLIKDQNGTLLLRIDDMDGERVRPEYINDIFETLPFLGIQYNDGPKNGDDFILHYTQHLRLNLYEKLLSQLIKTGLVFACTCSRKIQAATNNICQCRQENLPLETPNAAWRIHIPTYTIIQFEDEHLGPLKIDLATAMPHFVIRKKDGKPAYQVSSLADDLFYNVNYIVRGEDLLNSTAAQLYLAKLIGAEKFTQSRFYHHQLLLNDVGEKLSKSAGSTSIKALREKGLKPEEILEIIANFMSFT